MYKNINNRERPLEIDACSTTSSCIEIELWEA